MINKFEAVGIFISIGAMVLALFLLRLQTDTPQEIAGAPQPASVIVANEEGNTGITDALIQGVDAQGNVTTLIIDDVLIGSGAKASVGDTLTVHYIGRLQNGQEFDNSYKRGAPFTFTLGEGRVIQGWEEGLLGMQEGGKRILVVPPQMAYGDRGAGPIPGGATLVFAVELLSIE